jgi:uncharacterized protein (TIGR03067 family)
MNRPVSDGRRAASKPCSLEDCWDEPAPPENCAQPGLEELQGAWASVTGPRPAELFVAGNHFIVRFQDGDVYVGAFDLGAPSPPAGRPRAMDMRIEDGPARHKGKTALCAYQLDGNTLHWCAATPGRRERPAAFPVAEGSPHLYVVFRREGLI